MRLHREDPFVVGVTSPFTPTIIFPLSTPQCHPRADALGSARMFSCFAMVAMNDGVLENPGGIEVLLGERALCASSRKSSRFVADACLQTPRHLVLSPRFPATPLQGVRRRG